MEPLRGVWDWEKVEDLEVLIAPAGGKFGGSSVIGLTWRGGTFAEFYRKVSASPPPRPPPIIFFKPFTSDSAFLPPPPPKAHAHPYPSPFLLSPLRSFSLRLPRLALGCGVLLGAGKVVGCPVWGGGRGLKPRCAPLQGGCLAAPGHCFKISDVPCCSGHGSLQKGEEGESPRGEHPGTSWLCPAPISDPPQSPAC